jgi:hypothetical protein
VDIEKGFAALSKGFRTHMQRGSHTLHTFRHTITAAQLQGVVAQRTKDGLAAMKVVREQAMNAAADTARVLKELRAEVKQIKSGSPGRGKDRNNNTKAQRARERQERLDAQAAAAGAPAPGPAPSAAGGGGKGKDKGGKGGKGKGGKGGRSKWSGWLLEADRQKCTAKFGDVSYYDAMYAWFQGEDRSGQCFQMGSAAFKAARHEETLEAAAAVIAGIDKALVSHDT